MRLQTIKLLKENRGSNLLDISLSNIFLDMSPLAGEMKAQITYWDYIKLKNFCTTKETRMKRQLTKWGNIFANDISNKGFITKIYKKKTSTTQYQK